MKRLACFAILACGAPVDPADPVPLDAPYFRCHVEPVLDRSCSMLVCHGNPDRFFHVFTRSRLRLAGDAVAHNLDGPLQTLGRTAGDPLTPEELAANFANASALGADPGESALLLKPLAESAGGWPHGGQTWFGGDDVFLSRDDPDYRTIERWLAGATEDADCVYAGTLAGGHHH